MLACVFAIVGGAVFVYQALLPETLGPQIVKALEDRLGPGHRVTIGRTRLGAGPGGVELEVEDLAVTGIDGREVAAAPHALVRLDGGALVGGKIAVSALQLDSPSLVLRAPAGEPGDPQGAVQPPADPSAQPLAGMREPVAEARRDLVGHLVGILDKLTESGGAAAELDEIGVTSGSLSIDRGDGKPPETLDRVNLRVARDPAVNGFSVTLSSDGAEDRWSATLTSSPPTAEGRVFDLGLDNIRLSNLRRIATGRSEGPDARVTGHVNIEVERDMSVSSAEARLGVSDISVHVPDPVHPSDVHIEQVTLRGRWDGAARMFTLDPSSVADEGGHATLSGEAKLPAPGDDDIAITLTGGDILIPGDAGEPPLRLDRISLQGSYRQDTGLIDIAVGQILGPSVKIALSGDIQLGDSSPAVAIGLAAAPTTASAFKHLWPKFLLPDIRQWAASNVRSGTLNSFQMTLDIKPGVLAAMQPGQNLPDEALYIETTFADALVTPLPDFPTLAGMAGTLKVTGRTAFLQADTARVDTSHGPMHLAGSYRMPDTNLRFPNAQLVLSTDGSLAAISELFTQGKLGPNPLPPIIKASALQGTVVADARADFTIGPPEMVPPPVVRVSGDLKDVTIANLVAGKALENGNFQISRDAAGSSLKGEAKIAGAPAKIEMFDGGPGAGKRREVIASLMLDQASRTRFGFPSNAGIKGNVDVKVRMGLDEGMPIEMQADLASTTIDGMVPGFKKKAGAPGKVALNVLKAGDVTSLQDLVLEAGPVLVKGSADIDGGGELQSARLSTYRLNAGDDIRVSVDRSNDRLKVAIAGSSFDLRPLMNDLFSGKAGEENSVDLDLDLTLGSGVGYNGETVSNLRMSMARNGDRVRGLDVKADRIGGGRLTVTPAGEAGTFIATGTDAGSFFRFLDIYGKGIGGRFNLQLTADKGMSGVLEIENFQVKGEKAIAAVTGSSAIRTQASGGRNPEMQAVTDPSIVQFTKLRMTFDRNGGKLAIRDFVLWGPQIGLSLEGTLDFSQDKVNVVGTFVPAFALNNLFSKIPVIGFFLGGGSTEGLGLLGVTFRVGGVLSSPTLTINPMSAVAPGFLRKLFEFRQREAQQGRATAEKSSDGARITTPR